jgi:hypothetical protein
VAMTWMVHFSHDGSVLFEISFGLRDVAWFVSVGHDFAVFCSLGKVKPGSCFLVASACTPVK